MPEHAFIIDLVLAALAAFVGGTIAQRLGQPVILGYLVAGVLIGPFTPGPTADIHNIQVVAEIGVAFLMFALGAELSSAELRRLGRVAAIGGGVQIVGTMILGPLIAPLIGLSIMQGVFVGALLALSSTVVALKVLMARGELQALHGRVALGILVAQDLAVVPMAVALPPLVAGGEGVLTELGLAVLKGLAVLAIAYIGGARIVPRLLQITAVTRSRELFVLGIVGLALGTAMLTQLAGLSLAFGAFLAGLVIAESEYRAQVVAEVLPFRDLFASLFFVSVGMLINPIGLLADVGPLALLVGASMIGKVLITLIGLLALGLPGRTALLAGLSIGQVGEFSFVLARLGVDAGAVPGRVFDLTLAAALVTIVLTPTLMRGGPRLAEAMRGLPVVGHRFDPQLVADDTAGELRNHAVICGYGRVARELADALEARGMRYLVVEYNPLIVRQLRERGVPVVYGDAANPAVLEHVHLERARLLALVMPDADAAEVAARHARAIAPRIDIVARVARSADVGRLQRAGATEVVQPEFEAGVEVIRFALGRYGVAGPELGMLAAGRRAAFYARGMRES